MNWWERPCPCGKPWDLDRFELDTVLLIDALVADAGELVNVTIGRQTWRVLRRCIAFHGITAQQLLSGASGFDEVD